MELLRDTILEVNLDNLEYNIKRMREIVGQDVAMAIVVKANGYGNGTRGIINTIIDGGADYLAVATLTEAIEIRRESKDCKVLVMAFTSDEYLEHVVKNNITQTIFSLRQAKIINDFSEKYNMKSTVHIKYDTGFNRLGFKHCEESLKEIEEIYKLPNLNVEGLFTHFSLKNKEEDDKQYNIFIEAIKELESRGITFKYKHISDSIASIIYPQYRMDMVRLGAIIYGIKGFSYGDVGMKQIFTFKTKISSIKKLSIGEGVGYDYMWQAERESLIATLPFGYADGFPRDLSNGKGFVTIRGQRAPITGLICMDQCMVDVTDIEGVMDGDEVIIYGDGENNTIDIHGVSLLVKTNKNEIISRIGLRVPRVYIRDNKIVNIINYI